MYKQQIKNPRTGFALERRPDANAQANLIGHAVIRNTKFVFLFPFLCRHFDNLGFANDLFPRAVPFIIETIFCHAAGLNDGINKLSLVTKRAIYGVRLLRDRVRIHSPADCLHHDRHAVANIVFQMIGDRRLPLGHDFGQPIHAVHALLIQHQRA